MLVILLNTTIRDWEKQPGFSLTQKDNLDLARDADGIDSASTSAQHHCDLWPPKRE